MLDTAGQNFTLSYSTVGLGSGRGTPPRLLVDIVDSDLYYAVFEDTEEYRYISDWNGDTIWKQERVAYKAPFRETSKDSIVKLLDGIAAKYLFFSNPYIMSGGITLISIQHDDYCVEFSLKNTLDSISVHIMKIINPYLPIGDKIYIPDDWRDPEHAIPIVKDCPSTPEKTYVDILGEEYDLIRQNSDK